MTCYRIVTDRYRGYEVQVWRWWWLFWVMPICNTHGSEQEAFQWVKDRCPPRFVSKVVRVIQPEELL